MTEAQYPFALPLGTQISGYEIVRVLGVGGFGITYEGFNPVTRRRAAIKEFFPRGIASRENATQVVFSRQDTDVVSWALERFRRSTTELCEFRHPNIVEVLNYVPANETGYMFMEQVEGETLEHWLRKKNGPPTLEEMRVVLEPVCDALDYVHARKFIHRDIAPDNIMIRKDGRPMLIDFGAIKIIAQTAQTRAASGRSYGVAKQHYSPPEQMDEDAELDPRADVYALGAVLYRAVSGQPPADADKRKNDLILKGADSYVSVAQSARIPLPQGVIDIIDRSLSLKPAERPSSIAEFRAGLREDVSVTAVIAAAAAPEEVQPMPTPGFSGPGNKAAPPPPAAAPDVATSLLQQKAPPSPALPVEAAMGDMAARKPRSWLGMAAIATVVIVLGGVIVGSTSFISRTTTTTTTTEPRTDPKTEPKTNTTVTTGVTTVRGAIELGDRLRRENKFQDAIAAYTEALRLAGSSDTQGRIEALRGRGAVYGILSKYPEQLADLTDVIRFEPNNAVNYSARGTAYWFANEHDRAISDQTRAIQLDPRNAAYYGERARTNMWKKDYIAAIADYSDAIRLAPTVAYYYGSRGAAHGYRSDFTRAFNDYAEAIKRAPTHWDFYRERADLYAKRADESAATRADDLNRARADMDLLLRENRAPLASDFEKRGLIFEKLGNRAEALADLRSALAREPNRQTTQQAIRRLGG